MSREQKKRRAALEKLGLSALQARFLEVVGQANRSPNRTFLIRKIEEALDARAAHEASQPGPAPEVTQESAPVARVLPTIIEESAEEPALPPAPSKARRQRIPDERRRPSPATTWPRGRFASMTIEELQIKYLEAVGRPTGSSERSYLQWKIRQAEKGLIPIGPARPRRRQGEPSDVMIIPFRAERETVSRLDNAWRSLGLRSRMAFFRAASAHYLAFRGKTDVASLFEGAEDDMPG